MPQRKLTFVFGGQLVPTPQGPQLVNISFTGTLDDEDHYQKFLECWNSTPKKSFEMHATKDELRAMSGVLSAATLLDLTQVKYVHILEETELSIVGSEDIRDINDKKRIITS